MNKTLKTFLILAALNILFAIIGVVTGADGFALLILLTLSIVISVLIIVIVFIVQTRKKYLEKDHTGRKKARKMGIIIVISTLIILAIGWTILSFNSGYKIPESDKHKDWSYFPKGNNPDVIIAPLDSMYVYNLATIKNADYYPVQFTKDSIEFYDSNIGGQVLFGIMDREGKLKAAYDKAVSAYIDGDRIIVIPATYGDEKPPTICDVYNIKTLELKKEPINLIVLPEKYDSYSGPYSSEDGKERFIKKYRTPFFENLEGVKSFEEKPVYPASDKNRGYGLYKDKEGRLYQTDGYDSSYSFDILSPQCSSYTLTVSEFGVKTKADNIKQAEIPIIYKNNLNSGVSIAYGSPNGGHDGIYFNYYQTWLMYYTINIGNTTTSFKLEGGEKDWPYIRFYQLNHPVKDSDALYFIAESKIWKVKRK